MRWNRKSLIIAILPIAGLLLLGTIFSLNADRGSTTTIAKEKCPDDYGTDDVGSAEYLAATNKWTNDFYDAHPGASLGDWARARHQFWVDNNCQAALERYEKAKQYSTESSGN